MKRRLTVFILCLIALFSLNAEESDFTTAQAEAYNAEALYVVPRTDVTTLSDIRFRSDGRFTSFEILPGRTIITETWDAYRGSEKITKAEFFHTAGYLDLEEICLETEKDNRRKETAGTALVIVGSAGMITGTVLMFLDHRITPDTDTLLYVGAAVTSISAVPMGIGIGLVLSSDTEPDISSSFALGIADIYNQKLKAQIQLDY